MGEWAEGSLWLAAEVDSDQEEFCAISAEGRLGGCSWWLGWVGLVGQAECGTGGPPVPTFG